MAPGAAGGGAYAIDALRNSLRDSVSAESGACAHACSTNAATINALRLNKASLLQAVGQMLEHLIGGLDRARVHLVRALRLDHRHELLDDVDVRGLERALHQRAEPVQAGSAGLRRAAGLRLAEQVLTARLQA